MSEVCAWHKLATPLGSLHICTNPDRKEPNEFIGRLCDHEVPNPCPHHKDEEVSS